VQVEELCGIVTSGWYGSESTERIWGNHFLEFIPRPG